MIGIRRATPDFLEALTELFHEYRVFYGQDSKRKDCKKFVKQRLQLNDSVIFIGTYEGKAVGFTQLYPSFSTVSLRPLLILNDLYVHPDYRKKGIATALLEEAKTHCMFEKNKGLALETAIDNPAQKLYESLGWKKDQAMFHYFWTNPEVKNK